MLQGELKLPVPRHLRRGRLKGDELASVQSGIDLLRLMDGLISVAGAKILDFGCGVKLTQALLEQSCPHAKYTGLDVYREMVEFLQSSVQNNKFEFAVVDFYNEMYNKDGRKMAPDARLPIRDDKFDLITMFSVITHMVPDDAAAILSILRGYAHEGSKLIFSCFVDPKQTEPFYDFDPKRPMFKAMYRKDVLENIVQTSGWVIDSYRKPIKGLIADHYICSPG